MNTPDLSLTIVQRLAPRGYAHYNYATEEENEAARMRDWVGAADQIRPLIQDYHARLLSRVREREGALREMVDNACAACEPDEKGRLVVYVTRKEWIAHCAATDRARQVLAQSEDRK